MAEKRQELKIRTKLCGVDSSVTEVESGSQGKDREAGKFLAEMRRQLDFEQELGFGWL